MSIIEQAKKAVEQAKTKPVCWEVQFFDGDGAERMDWAETTSDEIAKKEVAKRWKGAKIYNVRRSKYTMEEIENLA
jgi:CRISPR/Cas system-associated endonuclease Cas1